MHPDSPPPVDPATPLDPASPRPGDTTTTMPEDLRRDAANAPDSTGVRLSRSGAVLGRPGAEHVAYGMRRDDAPASDGASEREIRGIETEKTPPRP